MINFYSYYNSDGLDKEEYKPLMKTLSRWVYPAELKPIEHIIKQHPGHAYLYARHRLKSRWPEAEPIIMKSQYYAYQYAVHVVKNRWLEAEDIIRTDEFWWECYCSVLDITG